MTTSFGGSAASGRGMPSGNTSFAVFDTSIYIENFQTGRFTDRMLRASDFEAIRRQLRFEVAYW